MSPKISICIPAYREPDLLRKLLESIAVQTFEDYEVIITDDSGDLSVRSVVKDFEKDKRIKYYSNPKTFGSPGNWNEAMKYASGQYIKIMHHDDWFSDRTSLLEFVTIMDQNPDVHFSFCATNVIGDDGIAKHVYAPSQKDLNKLARDPKCLFDAVAIGAPSVTIFKNNLGVQFDTNVKWVVDIDFYIRVLDRNKKFIFCPKALVSVSSQARNRITNESVNSKEINLFEYLYLYDKIRTGTLSDLKFLRRILVKFYTYDVTSTGDLAGVGIKGPLPLLIRMTVLSSRFLVKNKRIIKAMRRCFR